MEYIESKNTEDSDNEDSEDFDRERPVDIGHENMEHFEDRLTLPLFPEFF